MSVGGDQEQWMAAGIQKATWVDGWRSLVDQPSPAWGGSSGGGAPLDIRPPYFALAYIMKLP